jgi:gluconolactonase
MKLEPLLLALLCALPWNAIAQRAFPQPEPAREVTVVGIPGVVAAGAQWKLIFAGPDNADGIVGTADGGVLFAQEQPSQVRKLDREGKTQVFLTNTHGTGALAIDSQGRILGVERTCTDPGGQPSQCTEPTAVAVLAPEHKILADNVQGKSLGRLNDLMVAKNGGVYFNGAATYYMNPAGRVITIGENIRTNGILLSRDEKTLYVTNGRTLVAFDIQDDGSVKNQREFARLEGGGTGDGMAIDAAGKIYVSSEPGVQVFSPNGKYLGTIPTPRAVISVAFSGPDKHTLYVVGKGADEGEGKEYRTPPGVRNNAKSIYKLEMLSQGFAGRAK